MFGRKKLLEERISTAIRAEFEGLLAELEREIGDYRHRLRLKQEARDALERAEAEAQKVHHRRIAFKKRFWEAYYGKDEAALAESEAELRSLKRAVSKAEKSLKKAHEDFDKADFDEDAEKAALRKKAYAAEEKADLRIGALEKTIEEVLAETWRNVKGLSGALREESGESRFVGDREEEIAHHQRSA